MVNSHRAVLKGFRAVRSVVLYLYHPPYFKINGDRLNEPICCFYGVANSSKTSVQAQN